MARGRRERDEHDEDRDAWDERELPDESDMDADDEPEEVHCPYCKRRISEVAEVCPHCGSYISREDAPGRPTSLFIVIIVVLLVASFAGLFLYLR